MKAYLIQMRGCDTVVVAGETAFDAVEKLCSIWTAEEGGEHTWTPADMERLEEIGEYVG